MRIILILLATASWHWTYYNFLSVEYEVLIFSAEPHEDMTACFFFSTNYIEFWHMWSFINSGQTTLFAKHEKVVFQISENLMNSWSMFSNYGLCNLKLVYSSRYFHALQENSNLQTLILVYVASMIAMLISECSYSIFIKKLKNNWWLHDNFYSSFLS